MAITGENDLLYVFYMHTFTKSIGTSIIGNVVDNNYQRWHNLPGWGDHELDDFDQQYTALLQSILHNAYMPYFLKAYR